MNRPAKHDQEPAASVPSAADETSALSPTDRAEPAPHFAPPVEPGEVGRLGPYRIVKELGHGGMGAVYAALDTRLERQLALKVMLPQFAANPAAKERFLREARAAAKISHDNVVTVYEADERDGVPYIAMQFLHGYPLDEFLKKKGNPSIAQILRIARETAAGLAAAHRIGLVHRDIKPANLWLEAPDGRVKVLDFGLAKPLDAEVELTRTGAVVGTPAYMSPEQGRGLKVDHRTDLFSLGSVLYRLCTGRIPFHGPTTMSVLMALGTEEPTPVREINPAVPEALAALIHELLSKNPDGRPQSADEVVQRVRALAERPAPTGEQAAPPQVMYVPIPVTVLPEANPFADLDSTEEEPTPTAASAELPPARKKPSGRGPLILAGAALLLLVAVGGVIFAIKNKGGTDKKDDAKGTPPVGNTPGPVTPVGKPPIIDDSPDRKAAEYVLSVGGHVHVLVNGEARVLQGVVELPKERITLALVGLENRAVTDAGLANFKDCKGLVNLNLSGTAVTDAGLANFKDCKGLTHLNLGQTSVADAGLVNFKDCVRLTDLNLHGTKVTDAGLAYFRDCKALTVLSLHGTKVTDAGLANLADLKELIELDLRALGLTGAGLEHLTNLKNLKQIWLIDNPLTDDGLKHLKHLVGLTILRLNSTKVTDAGLAHLKDCKALTFLTLTDTAITDAGLVHLKDCKWLTHLDVKGTKVTHQGLAEFHAAVPGCAIEHDGGTIPAIDVDRKAAEWVLSLGGTVRMNGEDREIKAAADLPKERFTLTRVILDGEGVTDAGVVCLKDCKDLTVLQLQRTAVTDAGLVNFKDRKRLKTLILNYTRVTDAGLTDFKDNRELLHLYLADTLVTDTGLANFQDCRELQALILPHTKVTDAGLVHFKDCKALKHLDLSDTAVTDAGLANFKDCKELQTLHVTKTKVTAKGLAEFHAAVPGCRIYYDGGTFEPEK